MSKSKLLIYLSAFFALLGVIVLCFQFFQNRNGVDLKTLDPNLYDQSWFTGHPCNSPCWQGIEPGISPREYVLATVRALPFIDTSNIVVHSQGVSFQCKESKNGNRHCIAMSFNNDILETLWLKPNYPITFEQAVEKLGIPDGFSIYPMDPGATACYLGLAWKEKQLVLEHIAPRPVWGDDLCSQIHNNGGKIPKGMLVESIVISLPGYAEHTMNDETWRGFADK